MMSVILIKDKDQVLRKPQRELIDHKQEKETLLLPSFSIKTLFEVLCYYCRLLEFIVGKYLCLTFRFYKP